MGFERHTGTLPYASELLGVYQPLLGWKSRILETRYTRFRASMYDAMAARALVSANATSPDVRPFDFQRTSEPHVASTVDSALARMLRTELGAEPPSDWRAVINAQSLGGRLQRVRELVSNPDALDQAGDVGAYVRRFSEAYGRTESEPMLEDLLAKESKIAGYLEFLANTTPAMLDTLFFRTPRTSLATMARSADPCLSFGAKDYEAILSPIGVIHLYRQYFFELDSFLGPPVGHVWLSPGGTVELVEVSTRRTVVERTAEQSLETTTKSESTTTVQDDIADAVKQENSDNVKFGFSSSGSVSLGVFSGSASSELSIESTKTRSRETVHKQMRQQSEKLSSEIKRNFKTTFRTSTEETDTSSKRYVMQNASDQLVNYELRRKMRKVGVQVQDIGVALCWQTFVDDPARDVGVAKLVHIGEPPELSDLVQPDAPPMPTAQAQEVGISIPFVGLDTSDTDIAYTDGVETEVGIFDSTEHILADFERKATFQTPGYTLADVELHPKGVAAKLSVRNLRSTTGSSAGSFTIHLDYVDWNGANQIPVDMILRWEPSDAVRASVTAQYEARMAEYNNEKARRYKEAYYEAARERIRVASGIIRRPHDDLRQEERTVIFRSLVSQLMKGGTHRSKHVASELLRSIFDIDKMLYFVAPEWWTPRLHRSAQTLGEGPSDDGESDRRTLTAATLRRHRTFGELLARAGVTGTSVDDGGRGTSITGEHLVDWGGAKELNRDNYYITEESEPARLGASLGWLLQLDGDDLRNAFLNSPWVKAVIPIRVGKESAALKWLEQAHVEGVQGLDAEYVAGEDDPDELRSTPENTVTIRDAIERLIGTIEDYDRNARSPIEANPADPEDPRNHYAGSLPTEAVYEHGFYPLQGGVRFDADATSQPVFSQWMEVLPTDQVAALQVEYDPVTLQARPPGAPPPEPE